MWFINANFILNDIQLTQELHKNLCVQILVHMYIYTSFFIQATVRRNVNITSLLDRNQRLRYPLVI